MRKRILSVRRTAAALTCAAMLFQITSCNGHTSGIDRPSRPTAGTATVQPTGDRNGIEDLTAQQIYDKSRETNVAAGSYREQTTRVEAKTNLLVSATECSGTVEMTGQGKYEVVVQGRDIWARMDTGLAQTASKQGGVTVPEDTWLHGTLDHPLLAMVAGHCRMDRFSEPDTASAKLAAQLTKGQITVLNDGQQVVPISIKAHGTTITWYTATTGRPHYLRQDAENSDMADATYSDFGAPVNATAPTGKTEKAPAGSWPNSKLH
ncbi:hypothetical protein ACQEV9_45325 [Streptomyces chartreusis]|uniref:hypothetical protein n=1 Tax=Streptomyces chartreusis TaxID=1969 RepID=UPI003D946ED9